MESVAMVHTAGERRRKARLRWCGWALWLGLAALAVWRLNGQAADDIYITYRYADNFAQGRGLVFNPGERVFGVSDPGVAILLGTVHRLTQVPIPLLGTLLTAVAILTLVGTFLGAAREEGREVEAWLGGTLLLCSPYLWLCQGAGPLPGLAILLIAARTASNRPWLAGLFGGLAFCVRPDAAIGVAVLAALLLAESWRLWRRPSVPGSRPPSSQPRALASVGRSGPDLDSALPQPSASRPGLAALLARPVAFSVAFAAVVAAALLAAWSYYGQVLPGTLAVKRAFAALRPQDFVGLAFWQPAWGFFVQFAGGWNIVWLAVAALGVPVLFWRAGPLGRLLVLQSLALAVFYTCAAVPFFLWYTLPLAVTVLYGVAFLFGELARRVAALWRGERARQHRDTSAPVLAVAGAGLAAWIIATAFVTGARWWAAGGSQDWRLQTYRLAGEWLRTNTPATSAVAFDEVGIVGFYSDRPIRDLIGLVSPLSRPFAAAGDPLGAFLAAPPDVLLFQTHDRRGGTRPIRDRPWFAAAYPEVAALGAGPDGPDIHIYRRRPGAPIPPPRAPWPRSSQRQPGHDS